MTSLPWTFHNSLYIFPSSTLLETNVFPRSMAHKKGISSKIHTLYSLKTVINHFALYMYSTATFCLLVCVCCSLSLSSPILFFFLCFFKLLLLCKLYSCSYPRLKLLPPMQRVLHARVSSCLFDPWPFPGLKRDHCNSFLSCLSQFGPGL